MEKVKKIRWGILGTGYAAEQFAQGLQSLPDAELLAIGSRSRVGAEGFADKFGMKRAYASYDALTRDQDVDVIYVATPHSKHKEDSLLCLNAGKAVLCEKPFAMNANEAREVIALARKKRLFCMEAMWMRFMPLIQKVQELIKSGAIGEPCMLMADFGVPVPFDSSKRLFNPELGGGALLDRGVYGLSLAFSLFGDPTSITSSATIGKTGVDEQISISLSYSGGAIAVVSASLSTYLSNEAVLMGTQGKIRIAEPFFRPHQISVVRFNAPKTNPAGVVGHGRLSAFKNSPLVQNLYLRLGAHFPFLKKRRWRDIVKPFEGNGYGYEALEVMACLRQGALESKRMPLDETLRIMEVMDAVSVQVGLKHHNKK